MYPYYVSFAYKLLRDSNVNVCTVVGFPNGNCSTMAKVAETINSIKDGATEIDMVANIGEVLSGHWEYVEKDIYAVKDAITNNSNRKIILKVIVEICYLNEAQIVEMCKICSKCNADYIKTSTGFGSYGATKDAVKLMKKTIEENKYNLNIKASGGIRTIKDAKEYITIGADRIGASNLE